MARVDVYRVLLIRTGATEWDEREHLPGVADLPLCESARRGFGVGEETVGRQGLRIVLCADDEASKESAKLVSRAWGVKTRVVPGLGDVDLGLWQGMRMTEIRTRYPKVHRQWAEDPLSLNPPEGEALREAQSRMLDAFARALEKIGKNAKTSTPSVGVVLRPIAMGLMRAWLLDDPGVVTWNRLSRGPACEWHGIRPERLSRMRTRVPTGV
jgi:broad specificity phosphatase PhoE